MEIEPMLRYVKEALNPVVVAESDEDFDDPDSFFGFDDSDFEVTT